MCFFDSKLAARLVHNFGSTPSVIQCGGSSSDFSTFFAIFSSSLVSTLILSISDRLSFLCASKMFTIPVNLFFVKVLVSTHVCSMCGRLALRILSPLSLQNGQHLESAAFLLLGGAE